MLIHQAFDETLTRHRISGKLLAQTAGASESLVSQFRRGKKGVTDEMLDKLLKAMESIAPGARRHFCALVADESVSSKGSLLSSLDDISEEEIPRLLIAIARRWQSPQDKVLQVQ